MKFIAQTINAEVKKKKKSLYIIYELIYSFDFFCNCAVEILWLVLNDLYTEKKSCGIILAE